MRVKELMQQEVVTVKPDDPVDEVVDLLVGARLHGAPVVDEDGGLVGMVSQWDIYFGTMTRRDEAEAGSPRLLVGDIMTSPAVSASEETEVADLCRMMCQLRLHRVPIVRRGRLIGMVSALDVCRAVAEGTSLA